MKITYRIKVRASALALATILMSWVIVPAASADAIQSASTASFSRVAIVNALKDDYLSQACRSNNLVDLLYESYADFIGSQGNQFSDRYWKQFTDDASKLSNYSKSYSKWLKKNRAKFPRSVRADVSNMSRELTKEAQILQSLINAPTMDDLYFAWDQFDRHLYSTSYSSGQIRKALRLPSRIGLDACP